MGASGGAGQGRDGTPPPFGGRWRQLLRARPVKEGRGLEHFSGSVLWGAGSIWWFGRVAGHRQASVLLAVARLSALLLVKAAGNPLALCACVGEGKGEAKSSCG